ncbi:ribonuclease H-like domain-containing protein [Tanacetum coccineum]
MLKHPIHQFTFRRGVLGAAPCVLPSAFSTMANRDPTWNMDTVEIINGTVEFDAFGFSVKDFLIRHILLRCDSSGDLYPVTSPSPTPHALLSVSPNTWNQRLGHPGEDVLRSLKSLQYISYNKEKSSHLCHACNSITPFLKIRAVSRQISNNAGEQRSVHSKSFTK